MNALLNDYIEICMMQSFLTPLFKDACIFSVWEVFNKSRASKIKPLPGIRFVDVLFTKGQME